MGYNENAGIGMAGNESQIRAKYAQQAAAQEAYAQQTQAAPSPCRGSEAAIQDIGRQIDMLFQSAARLSAVTDRVLGSRPKDVAQSGAIQGNAQHMPLSGKLTLISDLLARLNNETIDSLERLEGFV